MAIGGSFRNIEFELYIYNRIYHLFPNRDCSILDVGPGSGKYGFLLKQFAKTIDCVEIFEPSIKINNLEKIYDNIFIDDICNFDFKYYDIIVFGDVLEHISVKNSQKLLNRIYNKAKEIIIVVPFNYEQGIINDNVNEVHLQPDLTHELFLIRYPKFKCLARNDYQGLYIKEE